MTPDSDVARVDNASDRSKEHSTEIQKSRVSSVFLGTNGLRAGWRLLIFILIFRGLNVAMISILNRIPAIHLWRLAQDPNVLAAPQQIYRSGTAVVGLFLALLLMSLIEKRSLADYCLAPGDAFGKRFWQGILYGLAQISLLMAVVAAFHGFSLGNVALSGSDAVKFGVLHGIGFILLGLFEEISFRGYLQSTLGSGIGFWPSAILLSLLFGGLIYRIPVKPGSARLWLGVSDC